MKETKRVSIINLRSNVYVRWQGGNATLFTKQILKEFHKGHPGMSRVKSLMKRYNYWPRMDQDIKKMILKCRDCQLAAKSPPIKTQPRPKTNMPWICVHIDYAGPLNRSYYLIFINSFSKWPEI